MTTWKAEMKEALDEQIPVTKVQPNGRKVNWVSNDTRTLMTDRDKARLKATTTDNKEDWLIFRKLRKQSNKQTKN